MNPQIENTLHDVLLKRIAKSRMTDNQYADKQGIDRGALNRLKNKRVTFGRLTLETSCRLFPEILEAISKLANISAPVITQEGHHNTTIVAREDNINIISGDVIAFREYQLKILKAIIGLDLDAKAKDTVLTAVNQVK